MTEAELLDSLRRLIDGFEGVPEGEVSTMPLLCAIQDTADFLGGEIGDLLHRIDEEYCKRAIPTMR